MAYASGCLLGWAKHVIGRFEWQQDVLTWLHGAKHLRHLDAVPSHDDGIAFGERAVPKAVCEDDWFHNDFLSADGAGSCARWNARICHRGYSLGRFGVEELRHELPYSLGLVFLKEVPAVW